MANKKRDNLLDGFNEANAAVLAEILVDPNTSEAVRLSIINELNEGTKNQTFFETMFNDGLSFGACPSCCHENHWLIPEDDLSQMGWVSSEKDRRVKRQTDSKDCEEFMESCSKKKVTM